MLKKSFRTILLIVTVNIVLFLAHIFAVFGLAFNDSSAEFPSVLHLLPNLVFCIGPLAVGSYFLIRFLAKKIDCYEPVLHVVQGIIVVCYIVSYIDLYVPNSLVRKVSDSVTESRAEKRQEKRDEKALGYLSDSNVEVYDEIENGGERITIYICHDSEKVVFQYCDDTTEQVGYCVADVNYVEGPEPDSVVKYRNLENGNTVLKIYYGRIYLGVGKNRYLCVETQDLVLHCEGPNYKDVGFIYFELLNRDVIENNSRYLPNDIVMLEIEEDDMVCRITEESLRELSIPEEEEWFAYGWTILRNGQEVLSRGIRTGEYALNLKELPEEVWKLVGTYEVYLHTYFSSDRYDRNYSGYIKASNSVIWEVQSDIVSASETASEGEEKQVMSERNEKESLEETPAEAITEIQLYTFAACESLKEIENNRGGCFLGCDNVKIFAPEGSYAEIWARENGYPVSNE